VLMVGGLGGPAKKTVLVSSSRSPDVSSGLIMVEKSKSLASKYLDSTLEVCVGLCCTINRSSYSDLSMFDSILRIMSSCFCL